MSRILTKSQNIKSKKSESLQERIMMRGCGRRWEAARDIMSKSEDGRTNGRG